MTPDDLIIAAPWIVFGGALLAVAIRLLAGRRGPGPRPGKRGPGPASSDAAHQAESDSEHETMSSRPSQEGQGPGYKTEARLR